MHASHIFRIVQKGFQGTLYDSCSISNSLVSGDHMTEVQLDYTFGHGVLFSFDANSNTHQSHYMCRRPLKMCSVCVIPKSVIYM